MTAHSSQTVALDNVLNFRDVGDSVNQVTSPHPSPHLQRGRLYRSARLDDASAADRNVLTGEAGIKTIIDLRSKTEHINAAKKHSALAVVAQSEAVPTSNSQVAEPLKMPGLRYEEINLNGKGFERALVWQLSYYSLGRLILLMALGYRTEGISILGKEIMQPRGLVGLGTDTLDHCGPEIKQVFDVFSDESAYPVLVHCTQGKDRTGITVLLVLLVCGVDLSAIAVDYVKSEKALEPEKAERMKEIESIGLDESFAQCPPDFCTKMHGHLNTKYRALQYSRGTKSTLNNHYLAKSGADYRRSIANQSKRRGALVQ